MYSGLLDLDQQFHVYFQTIFSAKLCASCSFTSVCVYLVIPSPVCVPHPTWFRTYIDFDMHVDMDRETV